MPKSLCAAILLSAVCALTGCYHAHLLTYGQPANSSPWPATLNLSAKPAPSVPVPGANPGSGIGPGCEDNGMQHVQVSTNFGSAFRSMFGARAPVDVGWQCRPKPPLVGPVGLGATPAPAAPPASGKRTVTPIIWGAFQTNVTPPPEKASLPPNAPPTPANCGKHGMGMVTISRSGGQALLTVVTLGFVSPMQLAWQCAGEK